MSLTTRLPATSLQRSFLQRSFRAIGVNLGLMLATFVLSLGGAELLLRAYLSFRYEMPFAGEPVGILPLALDRQLGWRANERFQFHGMRASADGSKYRVDANLQKDGFRMYGNEASAAARILILGDSFTEAVEVSNDSTYFAWMKRKLNAEIFAYGAGGYGTLQESMILDRYIDRLKPSLIVLQFTSNDFVNNSAGLEFESRVNNNGMVRPYLIDGRIVYLMPQAHPELRTMIFRSRVGGFVMNRIKRLLAGGPTVEQEIRATGTRRPDFQRSIAVTGELLARIHYRAGQIPVVMFSADDAEPFYTAGKQVAVRHGLIFVEEVTRKLRNAEEKGRVIRFEDGEHWNENGHRIIGNALSEFLVREGFIGPAAQAPAGQEFP